MAFNRIIEVSIGPAGETGTLLKNLRIVFEVEKKDKETPNRAKIQIYNVSKATAQKLSIVRNKVVLKAGYTDEGVKSLFFGDLTRGILIKQNTESIFEVDTYDGYSNTTDVKVSLSYVGGTPIATVLDELITVLGIPLGNPLPVITGQYVNGYAFIGQGKDALKEVVSFLGMHYTIQNEQLYITKIGKGVRRTGLVISPSTGMIGTPEELEDTDEDQKAEDVPKRYKVRSLLFPQIVPRYIIKLKSASVNGDAVVEAVTFSGDNWDGDFMAVSEVRMV